MTMTQEEFEGALFEFIASGEGAGISLLREQLTYSVVVSRENTGVGMYLNIKVNHDQTRPFTKDVAFGDVFITGDGLDFGGGAVAFIRNGYVTTIECYSYGDEWPQEYGNIMFKYSADPRDLSEINNAA